jgi:hypothetical protein
MVKAVRGTSASWAAYSNKNKPKKDEPIPPEEVQRIVDQARRNKQTRFGLKKELHKSHLAPAPNILNDPIGAILYKTPWGKKKYHRHP